MESMRRILNKRHVNTDHDGLWDGVIETIEEWRGAGATSFYHDTDEENGLGVSMDAGNIVYQHNLREADVMSPSGLKFGEGFVDDDDDDDNDDEDQDDQSEHEGEDEEAEIEGAVTKKALSVSEDDDDISQPVQLDFVGISDAEEEDAAVVNDAKLAPTKSAKKKATMMKKKKKKKMVRKKISAKKGATMASTKSERPPALNISMEVPHFPSRPKVKQRRGGGREAASKSKRGGDGDSDDSEAAVPYMGMSTEDFEKALFGPNSKQKGLSALVKQGNGTKSPACRSPRRKLIKKKKKKKKSKKDGENDKEKDRDSAAISNGGDDYHLLNGDNQSFDDQQSLAATIKTMTSQIETLERQINGGKKSRGKRKGKKQAADSDDDKIINEISRQVAARLEKKWNE